MKKNIYLVFFITITFFLIFFSNEIIESIRFSFSICINNIFPSFIPFMILSKFLIDYNFDYELSKIFEFLMRKFKVNKNCSIAFVMSIFSGSPSNAIYLNNLLNKNLVNENDVNKCLKFCHFVNPIFILNTIGYSFLNSKSLGLKILIAHYLTNIIVGLYNKEEKISKANSDIKEKRENRNFIIVLKESIFDTINNLLLIMGIITFFLIVTTILNNILNISNNYKFIYGILEITQGLKYLSLTNINTNIKALISVFLISFGGFSIHMQIFSIIDNEKIRYIPYLISRTIHAILSVIILYFILLFL